MMTICRNCFIFFFDYFAAKKKRCTFVGRLMFASLISSMPMYICTFWCVLLLLDVAEKRQTAKKRLLAYMAAAALLYMGHYVYFNRLTGLLPVSDTVYVTMNLAVFPLYYIYLKELTEPEWNHRWQWLLLAPAVVVGLTVGLLYWLMSPAETTLFVDSYLYRDDSHALSGVGWWLATVHRGAKAVFALLVVFVLFMGFRKIRKYEQVLEQNYADTDDKRLPLVKVVLWLFVVTSFISFLANVLGRNSFADSPWLLLVPSTVFSVLQFLLGYAGYRQQFTVRDLLRELDITAPESDTVTESSSESQHTVLDELPRQIADVVSSDRLFLQPNLKITDVADLLHTNRTYVSRVLKEEMGTTFADFINRQRIEYACQLMEQQPQLPASEVARLSGFSSQSSFYRNYKHYMGHAPKDNLLAP